MSFIFSQALVAASSLANSLDIDASALSNVSPMHKPSLWHDRTMEPSRLSRFGMTCAALTDDRGAALLTSWLAASHAKTSASRGKAAAWAASAVGYGRKWLGSFAKFDPATSSWKTAQCSLLEDSASFSATWPSWGSMRTGECWERQKSELSTFEVGSGLWPTPTASGFEAKDIPKLLARRAKYAEKYGNNGFGLTLNQAVKVRAYQELGYVPAGGLNPDWTESLMGWPIGQTAIEPLETAKFLAWQRLHGVS